MVRKPKVEDKIDQENDEQIDGKLVLSCRRSRMSSKDDRGWAGMWLSDTEVTKKESTTHGLTVAERRVAGGRGRRQSRRSRARQWGWALVCVCCCVYRAVQKARGLELAWI